MPLFLILRGFFEELVVIYIGFLPKNLYWLLKRK